MLLSVSPWAVARLGWSNQLHTCWSQQCHHYPTYCRRTMHPAMGLQQSPESHFCLRILGTSYLKTSLAYIVKFLYECRLTIQRHTHGAERLAGCPKSVGSYPQQQVVRLWLWLALAGPTTRAPAGVSSVAITPPIARGQCILPWVCNSCLRATSA